MSRWRQNVIRQLRSGYPLEEQDALSDSCSDSDDESSSSSPSDDYCSNEDSQFLEQQKVRCQSYARRIKLCCTNCFEEDTLCCGATAAEPQSCSRSALPLKKVICKNSLLMLVKAENPSIDEAKLLLSDRTPDDIRQVIKQIDTKGNSVIHYACAKALVPWVELLKVNGADLNVAGENGQTPIHFAVKGEDINVSQFEIAKLLLKNGADPLAKVETRGDTALHIILRKGQVEYALRFLVICNQNGNDMREILLAGNAKLQYVMDMVVKCGDKELVKYCMKHVGDDLLTIRSKDESTLMHTACKHGHHDIVEMLDKICSKLLASRNKRRLTPLHVACSRKQAEVTKVICALLKKSERGDNYLDIGKKESDSVGLPSVLGYAAKKGAIDCLMVLLKHDRSDLVDLLKSIAEENLSKVLKALLNRSDVIEMSEDEIKKLALLCAVKGQTECLDLLGDRDPNTIHDAYDEGNSLFHLIAQQGHLEATKAILKNPDVQTKKKNDIGQTALHVAIQGGHRMTSDHILKTVKSLAGVKDNNKMTPLMYACKTGNLYIVKLILDLQTDPQVKIGFLDCDVNGLNCLDHAINKGHEMIAVELLDQDNWRSLMTHATIDGGTITTPMRKLISSMPGVCKFVLDKCITPQGKNKDIQLHDVKIKVDFELLEDWYSEWMRDDSNTGDNETNTQRNGYKAVKRDLSTAPPANNKNKVSSNFEDGKLKSNALIHVRDRFSRSNNHPLKHMINKEESKELLNHPVVRLMFHNKFNVFRFQYLLRFLLQLTLLVFLTLHSLVIPPPYYVNKHLSGGNYTWLADGVAKWKEDLDPIALVLFGSIGTWLMLVLTVIYFLEFLNRKRMYGLTKSNSMQVLLSVARELTLIILIILFVVPGFGDLYFDHGVTFKADWQWELGAYAVFLSWINFIFFLQTAPFFGIYVIMVLEVISTMVNFLLVAGIFICTFAVVFCILIINQTQYHTFGDSLAKSLTMLTNGIDFDTVFHPTDYLYQPSAAEDFTNMVFYPNTTLVIFMIFLFSMPVVVMNLLTGLAVYDVAVIQKKANIVKQTIDAEGILAVQNSMPMLMWKSSVFQYQKITVFKNVSTLSAICYKLTGYKDTHGYLVAALKELDTTAGHVSYTKTTDMKIDDMMDEIEDNTIDAYTLHKETISGIEELKRQMQIIQDKLDKMCPGKVV